MTVDDPIEPGKPHVNRTGTINHLRLTVSDIPRARRFYVPLLDGLGYSLVEESASRLAWAAWAPHGTLHFIIMSVGNPSSPNKIHDRYSPGLHHLAWNVNARQDVDRLYGLMRDNGATILDSPADYDFEPGYYAFFFSDPDGMKLEVVYVPMEGSLAYWREFRERGAPRQSPKNTEPAFLRDSSKK